MAVFVELLAHLLAFAIAEVRVNKIVAEGDSLSRIGILEMTAPVLWVVGFELTNDRKQHILSVFEIVVFAREVSGEGEYSQATLHGTTGGAGAGFFVGERVGIRREFEILIGPGDHRLFHGAKPCG